jgi:hypothetical protein
MGEEVAESDGTVYSQAEDGRIFFMSDGVRLEVVGSGIEAAQLLSIAQSTTYDPAADEL